MTKPKMTYFEEEDILHLVISDDPESNSIELSPNIKAELNENSELIGIEILNASTFIQGTVGADVGWVERNVKNQTYVTQKT